MKMKLKKKRKSCQYSSLFHNVSFPASLLKTHVEKNEKNPSASPSTFLYFYRFERKKNHAKLDTRFAVILQAMSRR